MTGELFDLRVSDLLSKFGAGNHKPGSGSAAALQGIMAAQLIRTVIDLTKSPKRREFYANQLSNLLKIESEIEGRILPNLERLFHDDSKQFDKVIQLRERRDAEVEPIAKRALAEEALKALIPATEIPIRIAKECVDLAKFAIAAFDSGFTSARGDSGVAINAAVSALAGCLSIVELNLLSFGDDEWTQEVRESRNALVLELADLKEKAQDRLSKQRSQSDRKALLVRELQAIGKSARDNRSLSETVIEEVAIRLQRAIWVNRDLVWKNQIPERPFDILKPDKVLQSYGFQVDRATTLGQYSVHGAQVEVAGLIDQQDRLVSVSSQFPIEIQNFTIAHELGHSLLHTQQVLHRDRPLDGSALLGQRGWDEWQADKFATYFLMPTKLVKKTFLSLFLAKPFQISDETAFALNEGTSEALYEKCKTLRGLCRLLADATFYNGAHFDSISKQFGVSTEAMAIRLEELGLVRFP